MSAIFEMPETINGEEPPATVPFVKPASNELSAIKQKLFNSLGEAQAAYDAWVATCNWRKPPTLAFFVWASEHNWDAEDGLRIPENHNDFYELSGWEEDMKVKNDDRWFMNSSGDLTEYEDVPSSQETEAINQDTSASANDSHDEKFWRELEIMSELRTAEIARQEAQTAFDIATEERKEAKEHLASCTAAVARVTAKLVGLTTLPEPKRDQPGAAVTAGVDVTAEGVNVAVVVTATDDSWRKEPTTNIIKGLPGLGAKKLEAICEKAPTVGDLEDLRAKASTHHSPFKEMLPKGCGESIAQAIEDALLDFMFKWKDRPGVTATPPRSRMTWLTSKSS